MPPSPDWHLRMAAVVNKLVDEAEANIKQQEALREQYLELKQKYKKILAAMDSVAILTDVYDVIYDFKLAVDLGVIPKLQQQIKSTSDYSEKRLLKARLAVSEWRIASPVLETAEV